MAFAQGKYAYRISDRSGFRYRIKDMRKEWNGSIVGYDEYEEKHPQLTPPRIRTDLEAIRDARPDRTETAVPNLLPLNAFSATSIAFLASSISAEATDVITSSVAGFMTLYLSLFFPSTHSPLIYKLFLYFIIFTLYYFI